jgi:hypothetical protein
MPPLPDDKLTENACADDAYGYLTGHDNRVRHIDAMSDEKLRRLYNAALRLRSMELLSGTDGWSHDELVNSIATLEFPDITEAREIWYRNVQMPAIGEV